MISGDHRRFEKSAQRILDVFSDGRVTDHDLMYVALYTVVNAYPENVLDRLVDFVNHVTFERERIRKDQSYVQDTLF